MEELMRKGNLSRRDVVAMVGEELVKKLEAKNCDPTGRLLQTDGDDAVEYSASICLFPGAEYERTIIAYYYQEPADLYKCENDLSYLSWKVNGFEII
jgi:hypothetical protein